MAVDEARAEHCLAAEAGAEQVDEAGFVGGVVRLPGGGVGAAAGAELEVAAAGVRRRR